MQEEVAAHFVLTCLTSWAVVCWVVLHTFDVWTCVLQPAVSRLLRLRRPSELVSCGN